MLRAEGRPKEIAASNQGISSLNSFLTRKTTKAHGNLESAVQEDARANFSSRLADPAQPVILQAGIFIVAACSEAIRQSRTL